MEFLRKYLRKKIVILNCRNLILDIAYTVDIVCTVDMVYTVDMGLTGLRWLKGDEGRGGQRG